MSNLGRVIRYLVTDEDIEKWKLSINKHMRPSFEAEEHSAIIGLVVGENIDGSSNLYLLPNSALLPPMYLPSIHEGNEPGQWLINHKAAAIDTELEGIDDFSDKDPLLGNTSEENLSNSDDGNDSDSSDTSKSKKKHKK